MGGSLRMVNACEPRHGKMLTPHLVTQLRAQHSPDFCEQVCPSFSVLIYINLMLRCFVVACAASVRSISLLGVRATYLSDLRDAFMGVRATSLFDLRDVSMSYSRET